MIYGLLSDIQVDNSSTIGIEATSCFSMIVISLEYIKPKKSEEQ